MITSKRLFNFMKVSHKLCTNSVYQQFIKNSILSLQNGKFVEAKKIARMLGHTVDTRSEKIISNKYEYLWICNPKVASRSLIMALQEIDPCAKLIHNKSIHEIYKMYPETRNHYTFTFLRHPFDRIYSFYTDKCVRKADTEFHFFCKYYGLSKNISFDNLCVWLNTPYGSDIVANRHWLSQHIQIRLEGGRMPNFIGHYDSINKDWKMVCTYLGMPTYNLPTLNARPNWLPTLESCLSDNNKTLLKTRYLEDLKLMNYLAP